MIALRLVPQESMRRSPASSGAAYASMNHQGMGKGVIRDVTSGYVDPHIVSEHDQADVAAALICFAWGTAGGDRSDMPLAIIVDDRVEVGCRPEHASMHEDICRVFTCAACLPNQFLCQGRCSSNVYAGYPRSLPCAGAAGKLQCHSAFGADVGSPPHITSANHLRKNKLIIISL